MSVLLFLDVSGGELIVVLLFVLLFFGSKGVPDVARTMGRTLRQLRDASADVQREIEKGASDVRKGFEEQKKAFRIEPPEHAAPQKTAQQEDTLSSPEAEEPEATATTAANAPDAKADLSQEEKQ
ncbi:MAG: twin-arginine translocase TatA/TatE family subunit [Flavobacteriales bacterium]